MSYCVKDGIKSKNTTKWVNGDLLVSACPNQEFKSDVEFIRVLMDTLSKLYVVNNTKRYVSGFSNGAAMSGKLANELSDIFAAATSNSGGLHDLDSTEFKNKIPIWNMFGTHDSMFIEATGLPGIPFNDTCLIYLQNGIQNFTGSLGLNNKIYSKDSSTNFIHYTFTTSLSTGKNAFFRFSIVKGLEHSFPNGINYPIAVAPLFWNFFKSYSKTTTPVSSNITSPQIDIFPNPASESINIKTTFPIQQIEFIDKHGKLLLQTKNPKMHFVLPDSPAGILFLKLYGENQIFVRKVMKY